MPAKVKASGSFILWVENNRQKIAGGIRNGWADGENIRLEHELRDEGHHSYDKGL